MVDPKRDDQTPPPPQTRVKGVGRQQQQQQHHHISVCEQNYSGSACTMEPHGVIDIFRRSVDKHDLVYSGYLGDGDSKSYSTMSKADPPIYTGKSITKYECCGHV